MVQFIADMMKDLLNGLGATFVDELSSVELVAMFKDVMRMIFAFLLNILVFVSCHYGISKKQRSI